MKKSLLVWFSFLTICNFPLLAEASAHTCQQVFDTASKYHVKHMSTQSRNDDLYENNAVWLNENQRREFRVYVGPDGLLYDSNHKLLNLSQDRTHAFVMDSAGRIFVQQDHIPVKGRFYHSSFLAGGPAAAAGVIKVVDGKIQHLDNSSGHYQMSLPFINQMLIELKSLGAQLDGLVVRDFTGRVWTELPTFTAADLKNLRRMNAVAQANLFNELSPQERRKLFIEVLSSREKELIEEFVRVISNTPLSDWTLIEEFILSSNQPSVISTSRYLKPALSASQPLPLMEKFIQRWMGSASLEVQETATFFMVAKRTPSPQDIEMLASKKLLLSVSGQARENFVDLLRRAPMNEFRKRQLAEELLATLESSLTERSDKNFGSEVTVIDRLIPILKTALADDPALQTRIKAILNFIVTEQERQNDTIRRAQRLLRLFP